MKKLLLSSSIDQDLSKVVKIANELNLGIEISRLPKHIDIDNCFNQVEDYLCENLSGFKNEITMHGQFSDLNIASLDKEIKKISEKRYYQSLKLAKSINASTLLFHTNKKSTKHIGAQKKFDKNFLNFWQSFIKDIEKTKLTVVLENVHEKTPDFIKNVIKEINSNQLKASLDIGHVNVYSDIDVEIWLNEYKDILHHMHIHNNFGDDDSHFSIIKGSLDCQRIVNTLKHNNLEPIIVFEVFNLNDLKSSLDFYNKCYASS